MCRREGIVSDKTELKLGALWERKPGKVLGAGVVMGAEVSKQEGSRVLDVLKPFG